MIRRLLLLGCVLALLAACGPKVLTQQIPVSSNPAGALVKADDGQTCRTPCQVKLTRNADHALSITKDGYRQQDVLIRRQYQSERVMARAVNEGMSSGQILKNPYMGINSGVQSMDEQEQTGEAYLLEPSAVSVTLLPEGGNAAAALPGLEALDASDQAWVSRTLETLPTGQNQSWTNASTGLHYTLFPGPAHQENGVWIRSFTLRILSSGVTREVTGQAARAGAGQWNISGAPAGAGNVTTAQPPSMDMGAAAAGTAVGAASGVSVPVVTGKDGSSHTSTTTSSDGSSTSTKTSSTSVKGSVSVNPGAVLQDVLEMESGTGAGQ